MSSVLFKNEKGNCLVPVVQLETCYHDINSQSARLGKMCYALTACFSFLFLSLLVACVYSRALGTHKNGWKPGHKKHRSNTNLPWDHPLPKKRVHFFPTPNTDECCPSVTEIIQPFGGVSKQGRMLELYQDQNSTQSFYQTSCKEGVKGRHCKYLDRESQPRSMCVQRYSYTYALVREVDSMESWRLDYIRVRSGCSCEIRVKNHDFYERKRRRFEGLML